ncbi:ribonuclease III [Spirulina sp. CCNP1310]|uniref:ribonuclease III n=1 Tax=Spirulina sp. CCNP1310 TaxID=3110249 RepID=UPI002B200565|nr:ribonuclease III [Spirulina sp. CCNP1310]MEA5421392.1 ribonuclease III [Spirulina sp. CCNP1310]
MTMYREMIDQDLLDLRDELYHLVINKIDPESLDEIRRKNKLSQDQDICFLLTAIEQYWHDFKEIIDEKDQTEAKLLLSQIRHIRNRHAHQDDFDLRDTFRALDKIERLTHILRLKIRTKLEEQCTELFKQIAQSLNEPIQEPVPDNQGLTEAYAPLLKELPFRNVKMLDLALTHASYFYENPHQVDDDNERLEFLGDTVIGLIIAHYFYQKNPRHREAQLTQAKISVENNLNLARFAKILNLEKFVKVGHGNNPANEKILADTFEAVLGAYFIDSGLEAVTKFMAPFIESMADLSAPLDSRQNSMAQGSNYKQKLQHWTQTKQKSLPNYEVVKSGLPHSPIFIATVMVGNKQYGKAQGKTKKQAEQQAAFDACKRLGLNQD